MKFLVIFFLIIGCCNQLAAQRMDSASVHALSPQKQEQVNEYLRQAKNAKTTGISLCMGGGSLAVAGIIYSIAVDINSGYIEDYPSYNNGTKIAIIGAMIGLSG